MEAESSLASGVRSLDKAYDEACKRVLSEKQLLARILHEWVSGFGNVSPERIAAECFVDEPRIGQDEVERDDLAAQRVTLLTGEDATIAEGKVTFDIRFLAREPDSRATSGTEVNVEAQNNSSPGYPLTKRGIYYAGRLISMQGADRVRNSHYERLDRVVTIWVCTHPTARNRGTVTRFGIEREDLVGSACYHPEDYDLMEMVMVCLDDKAEKPSEGTLGLLAMLLVSDLSPQEKVRSMKEDYGMMVTETYEERVTEMCNLSAGVLAEGMERGREDTLVSAVRDMEETLHLAPTEALESAPPLRLAMGVA